MLKGKQNTRMTIYKKIEELNLPIYLGKLKGVAWILLEQLQIVQLFQSDFE